MKNYKFTIGVSSLIIILFLTSCMSTQERLAKQEADRVIERAEKEIEIGKAAYAKIAGKYGVLKDNETTAYLNKLGKSLSMYTERQEIEYFFTILDSDQVNAYALPGGYIMITRGAINAVPDLPAFVGVISHELGHINLKHILKHVKIEVKYNFFELLARLLAGPRNVVTGLASVISNKIEEQLFINGLDVEDEFEADQYSIKLMQSLNISATNYIKYIESMKQNIAADALESLDKTHPSIEKRLEKMQEVFNQNIPTLKDSENFQTFKKRVLELSSSDKNDETSKSGNAQTNVEIDDSIQSQETTK